MSSSRYAPIEERKKPTQNKMEGTNEVNTEIGLTGRKWSWADLGLHQKRGKKRASGEKGRKAGKTRTKRNGDRKPRE